MEEEYEYANKFGKQGRKNPRNIPKFTINHERFSCAIEKISETYAHAQFSGISNVTVSYIVRLTAVSIVHFPQALCLAHLIPTMGQG